MYYIIYNKKNIVKLTPNNQKKSFNNSKLSDDLFRIRKNIFLNNPEKKRKDLFGNLKEKRLDNPLMLIDEFKKKKQLEISKTGKLSIRKSYNNLDKLDKKEKNENISLKKKELSDFLKLNVKRNKNKNLYEGSSFLSPSNNKIISELDVMKWRHNLKTSVK